jgi:hypothetical protein
MYAHQVVEDLKNTTAVLTSESTQHEIDGMKKYSEAVVETAKTIEQRAVCFSLGDINGILENKTILTPINGQLLSYDEPFPYPVTFIDWKHDSVTNDSTKGAVLVISGSCENTQRQGIQFLIFSFGPLDDGQRHWSLCPDSYIHFFDLEQGNLFERISLLNQKGNLDMMATSFEMTMARKFLDLIHCQNIAIADNHPPAKLNKKRAKNNKCPLFTYKTLVIKPTGKKQEAQDAQDLWENRVHLCRGHFKTYTEEKPLFGRITGRYFWQPSVRGTKSKGIVMKNYEIKTEKPLNTPKYP